MDGVVLRISSNAPFWCLLSHAFSTRHCNSYLLLGFNQKIKKSASLLFADHSKKMKRRSMAGMQSNAHRMNIDVSSSDGIFTYF